MNTNAVSKELPEGWEEGGLWECYEPEDDEDDDGFDCHKDSKGFCGKAGSEECEFECPYR